MKYGNYNMSYGVVGNFRSSIDDNIPLTHLSSIICPNSYDCKYPMLFSHCSNCACLTDFSISERPSNTSLSSGDEKYRELKKPR